MLICTPVLRQNLGVPTVGSTITIIRIKDDVTHHV